MTALIVIGGVVALHLGCWLLFGESPSTKDAL